MGRRRCLIPHRSSRTWVGTSRREHPRPENAARAAQLHATKAEVEEGVVAGGGVALLFASEVLPGLNANNHQKVGIEIVGKAIHSPVRQIAENSGVEGSIVVGKLTDKGDPNFSFDAQPGEYKDMVAARIIDPTKVVRVALQDAASVAGLLITTEAMVADRPEPKGAPGMPPGGRGGMGGMDYRLQLRSGRRGKSIASC
jgi:chaperonin GroEL